MIRSFDIADNAAWATYTGVSTSNSNRSYLLNLKTMESTLISDPYSERLSKLNLGDVKDWSFKSSFGDVVEGRYYLPPDFNPDRKYPLIVYYYGGGPAPHREHLKVHTRYMFTQHRIMWFTLCSRAVLQATGRSFLHAT